MRSSEFWELADAAFGPAYSRSLVADLGLDALGGRTAAAALEDGVPPRDVWVALCDAQEVPEHLRWRDTRRGRRAGSR